MARALPKRKRNPRVEVTLEEGGLTRELMLMKPCDQYAVLSAVRGPDAFSDFNQRRLKNYIVERLRSIVFSEHLKHLNFPGNYDNTPLTRQDLVAVRGHLAEIQLEGKTVGSEHFLSHLRLALKATSRHEVWGGYGYDLYLAVGKAVGF